MSEKSIKTVKITETKLVNLIDKIVAEAVTEKKVEWLAEQEASKATLLETKVESLEKKIKALTESKK
jgi:hypothetical protein